MKKVSLDVFLSMDSNFVFGAGTLIVSVIENNPNIFLAVHVLSSIADHDYIQKKFGDRINELYPNNFSITLHTLEQFEKFTRISNVVNRRMAVQCGRLFLGDIKDFAGTTVLFIDADVVCCAPFLDMLEPDYESKVLLASASPAKGDICGFSVNKQFWAGLMFVNKQTWNDFEVGEKCTQFICKYRPKYNDQDALNVVLNDNWKALPNEWQAMWHKPEEAAFVHYPAGKPWDPWVYNTADKDAVSLFRKYAKIFEPDVTKWISFKKEKDSLINYSKYSTRFATKWIAKRMLKRGHYFGFVYFMIQHYIVKVRQKGIIGLLLFRSNTRS